MSTVESLAFTGRYDAEDVTAQCPLALNGKGPYPDNHCPACDRALRPPRPYQVWDYLGHPIVTDWVNV